MLPTNPLLNATAPAGPHLPASLLRQYAAGTLAPAAQHRVEAHTLACSRCADILAGLQQSPPATTDQALAQLQQRLRLRVLQQVAPARYDREERRNHWLIPQLAAAAALLLGLVASGWWAWQQRHPGPPASRPLVVTSVAPPTRVLRAVAPPVPPAQPTLPALPAAPSVGSVRRQAAHRLSAARMAAGRATRPLAPVAEAPTEQAEATKKPLVVLVPAANVPAALMVDSMVLGGKSSEPALKAKQEPTNEPLPRPTAPMPAAPKLPPTPLGGYSALREKLRREATEFKPEAPERAISGTVRLRLTIGADGKIQQTKVLRGLRADYDAEAQRLLCDGPGWIPGISGGRRAPLDIDVAVPF